MRSHQRSLPTTLRALALLLFGALLVLGSTPAAAAAAADIPLHQRHYIVTAKSIKAYDESGPFNSITSDEIYGGFQTTHAYGLVTEVQSRLFGNFDAGDTRSYDWDQSCLGLTNVTGGTRPWYLSGMRGHRWSCHQDGIAAPFTIKSALYERDTEVTLLPCGFPCEFSPSAPGPMSKQSSDDDGLGTSTLHFTREGLALDLPFLGSLKSYPLTFTGGGAHYKIVIDVRRVV
jgi:hypothetical protein